MRLQPTYVLPDPPRAMITINVPTATITGTFLTDSDTGQSTYNTTLYIEEISNATEHAGHLSTRFFHLMFNQVSDHDLILALLNGLAITDGSGFFTFYNNLTSATASAPQPGQPLPPSNPLGIPFLPNNGDPTDWLDSVIEYLDSATDFYGDNLKAGQTTCFTMIVTTEPNNLMEVLSIGIAAGLHTYAV